MNATYEFKMSVTTGLIQSLLEKKSLGQGD